MIKFREWSICHISLFVTFVISGILINMAQFALFLLVGLFSRRLFRKINFYFNWMIHAQVLFIGTWWSQSKGLLYAESSEVLKLMGKENGLVIMNHHYEVDWMFGWMGSDNYQVLGNSRVFVKKMISYVPVVGWSWLLSDFIFLARDWEKDKLKLAEGVKQLSEYPDPMWLLLFAEGTRVSPEKLEASREFALKRNLPTFKHHLVPRTKGFVETIKNVDTTKLCSIYDVTLAMPSDAVATVSTQLFGRKAVGHMYVRKFDIASLPKDDEGLVKFLMDLYKDKDELKENFLTTGSFTSADGKKFPVHKVVSMEHRWPVLINSLFLNICVCVPLAGRLGWMVTSGSIYQIILAVAIVAVLYFGLRKFINLTRIAKASAYGGKKSD